MISPLIFSWEFNVTVSLVKQEAAALAARRVAFILQAGQRQGVHFAIAPTMAPASPVAAHQEPV